MRFASRPQTYRLAFDNFSMPSFVRRICTHRSPQHGNKLLDSCFLLLRHLATLPEEARVKFGGQQRILKSFHSPVQNRNDHFDIHIVAQFPAVKAEAHKRYRTVRIFCNQEAIDLASENEVCAVIAQQRNAIRDPVFA